MKAAEKASTVFYRDTWAEIDLDAIQGNVKAIKEYLTENVHLFAVVKANAYGHGAFQVAKAALDSGADSLAVALLDEALALRKRGIEASILVLGPIRPADAKIASEYRISVTVFQEEWLEEAEAFLGNSECLSLHIKCDTGMGRIGVKTVEELKSVELAAEKTGKFLIEGIYTHYATADQTDDSFYQSQLSAFKKMVRALRTPPRFIHAANSAAALCHPLEGFNAVRVGISMYGLAPSEDIRPNLPVEGTPAFTLHSRLTHVKRLEAGESVSYGAVYRSGGQEWIGTVPIGYADGWLRSLQGQDVLVEGKRAPIVGRICMDQCMVRLPGPVPTGTKVTLIGHQGDEQITADDIAARLGTINYEIPCMISSRVPRVFVKEGSAVAVENPVVST